MGMTLSAGHLLWDTAVEYSNRGIFTCLSIPNLSPRIPNTGIPPTRIRPPRERGEPASEKYGAIIIDYSPNKKASQNQRF